MNPGLPVILYLLPFFLVLLIVGTRHKQHMIVVFCACVAEHGEIPLIFKSALCVHDGA
jgi:hypothetical protein